MSNPKHSSICPAYCVVVDPTSHEKNVEAKRLLKPGVASHCEACACGAVASTS